MFKKLILFCLFITLIFGLNRPKNYWAGSYASRGDQQVVSQFAAYNVTSGNWIVVIPPQIIRSQVYGFVTVGNGLLAYGSFNSLGGGQAAGLAYYDGSVWSAPEGVGLYSYSAGSTASRYDTLTTGVGTAVAATVVGNDVYIYGSFNQVGLVRTGVAGFVRLTWSSGVFIINTVGNGYFQTVAGVCTSFCPGDTQPAAGTVNKLTSTTINGQLTFLFQDTNNLYSFVPNSQSWIGVSSSNGARGLYNSIQDFDVNNGNIYVVGKFDNTNDGNPAKQYLHIATSSDGGNNWYAVSNPQPLNYSNFATLGPVINQTTGQTIFPGLNAVGLTAISVVNSNQIIVAGGYRVTSRNTTVDNLAGQMQTRIFVISGGTISMSERFANSVIGFGSPPEYIGTPINKIIQFNGQIYAFGGFDVYRQVVPYVGARFGNRFTNVLKGAALFSNGVASQAFGGFLTTTYNGDTSSTKFATAATWANSGDVLYFLGVTTGTDIYSSYNLVSGGIFRFSGDSIFNDQNKWRSVGGTNRFVTASSYNSGIGAEGTIRTLHLTKRAGDALFIGGTFDWIGSSTIAGVAWYSYDSNTINQVGGGLYYVNSNPSYGSDTYYNNRIGGNVYDFEERNNVLYAAGQFNRNNSGNALYNIAQINYRVNGAGWQQLDGGCDNIIRDLLVVGNLLYATGDFNFCGLLTDSYTGSQARGRIPASYIAVINLAESKPSWRNLGIGLDGSGYAMAYRNGDLFVGGSFGNAGGKLYTSGIARWRGNHWVDVVARCRDVCDRPQNVFNYILGNPSPPPTSRLPSSCYQLRSFNGYIWCHDNVANKIAYFDSNTWYQGENFTLNVDPKISNTLIGNNGTQSNVYLFSGSASASTTYGPNGANLLSFQVDNNQIVPTYGGFSNQPNSFSSASFLVVSTVLLITILFVSYLF